jgi:hypothetical protein
MCVKPLKLSPRLDYPALLQTVDLTARLPAAESSNLGSATIRVLVVDPEGLVTIYSPVSPSESVSPAVTIGSDVRSKVISKVMAGHRKKINTEVIPTTTKSPTAVSRQFNATPPLAPHNLFMYKRRAYILLERIFLFVRWPACRMLVDHLPLPNSI